MTQEGNSLTALEEFMRKGPENREKVIQLLMDTCVFVDVVELHSPEGHEKLAALVDGAGNNPEFGAVFVRFMYARRQAAKKS